MSSEMSVTTGKKKFWIISNTDEMGAIFSFYLENGGPPQVQPNGVPPGSNIWHES